MRATARIVVLLLLWAACNGRVPAMAPSTLIVVANADTPALDADTLQKIYLGKVVEVGGRSIIPVNLTKGSSLRAAFMEQVLAQDDEKFTAYWTVRRYIGKGSPPREFDSPGDLLEFVRKTPGAVGYVSENPQSQQGVKTLVPKR